MPGEEVVLAGTGGAPARPSPSAAGAAEVLETTATALKVRVPALNGPPGTSAPVVVTMAGESSNPLPFLLGHLPLVSSLSRERPHPATCSRSPAAGSRPTRRATTCASAARVRW